MIILNIKIISWILLIKISKIMNTFLFHIFLQKPFIKRIAAADFPLKCEQINGIPVYLFLSFND